MKTRPCTIALTAAFALASASALAAEPNAPPKPAQDNAAGKDMSGHGGHGGGMGMMGDQGPGGGKGMMGGGGMGMMDEAQMDAQMQKMQDHMLESFEFMYKIHEAKDEKEKAKIKADWLAAMKKHMHEHMMKMHGGMGEHGGPPPAPPAPPAPPPAPPAQ